MFSCCFFSKKSQITSFLKSFNLLSNFNLVLLKVFFIKLLFLLNHSLLYLSNASRVFD